METKEKNKHKLLWALPLLILPFLALAFYALGGGRGAMSPQNGRHEGINTNLPDAQFKKADPQDKLSLYEVAGRDSATFDSQSSIPAQTSYYPSATAGAEESERQIKEKLEQINREINRPVGKQPPISQSSYPYSKSMMNGDVDRLERLMRSMQTQQPEDPEMQQLNGMLDKIIAIQNPEFAVKTMLKPSSNSEKAFEAIPVVVEGDQRISQGGVVKLRLLDTIRLKGQIIPKNQLLFGSCNITNQRLILNIYTIRLGTSIIPVDLSVYDLDGIMGINLPETFIKEAVPTGTDDVIRNIQLMTIDQPVATQVAGAGISVAKGLFGKRVKRVKVKLKAGQPALLRNNAIKEKYSDSGDLNR